MEGKVLQALNDISYKGPLLDKSQFSKALEDGPKSIEFTKVVSFITNELRTLCSIDEQVNTITNSEDSVTFLMELSSFLKELGCSYSVLTQGHISDRLSNFSQRLLLLDYLLTQLMAVRMLREKKPEKKIELKLQETPEAADMRKLLMTLRFPKPPSNITVQQLFQKLIPTVQSTVEKAGNDLVGNPIFNSNLNDKQWNTLTEIQKDLHTEYTIRREMLLKRLDCTIQSFQWSDKTKGKDELIEKIYMDKRKCLKVEPEIDLSSLLSARDDIAVIEKTSSSSVRKNTQSSVNKVIIGQVPDRGGRTSEQAPPPPEMPSWQQRSSGPSGGGRGGRGGRGDFNNRGGGGRGDFGNRGGGRPQTADYSRNSGSFDSAGSYGGSSNFQRVGNDYSQGGSSNYNKGKNDHYNRGGNNYYNRDNNDSYNRNRNSDNDYSSGSNNYKRRTNDYQTGSNRNFDSAGSFGRNNHGNSSRGGFDSAGSFGGYSADKDYQSTQPKRAKTYDSFQTNKTTYAEQYVQDTQHNQQYVQHDNRNRGGRGRSSYNRGGGGGSGGYTSR